MLKYASGYELSKYGADQTQKEGNELIKWMKRFNSRPLLGKEMLYH